MIGVAILGSTGSIGVNTLDVLSRHPGRFQVVALVAHRQVELMARQCFQWHPRLAVLTDPQAAARLRSLLADSAPGVRVESGMDAVDEAATLPEVQQVMAAIVGAAGLSSTLAAARAGKRVLLANKESLVLGGALVMDALRQGGSELLPIDSEHNAVFQCLPVAAGRSLRDQGVEDILLTASGGPFLNTPLEALAQVTPEQACAHPNWSMGRKISVDSATMMNKGLEVIEASWLFQVGVERLRVVIHPQSIVHSMVRYRDGSVLAQLGNPDMRTPIAHALAWPERMDSGVAPLDLTQLAGLKFEHPDLQRFPSLGLAFAAVREGGTAPGILNAANEVAVEAFLRRQIRFTDIPVVVERVLESLPSTAVEDLPQLLDIDQQARRQARHLIEREPRAC